eukprot:719067-Pelagomonas_calceolata.AAC.1
MPVTVQGMKQATLTFSDMQHSRQFKQYWAFPGGMGLLGDMSGLQLMGMCIQFSEFHLQVI